MRYWTFYKEGEFGLLAFKLVIDVVKDLEMYITEEFRELILEQLERTNENEKV